MAGSQASQVKALQLAGQRGGRCRQHWGVHVADWPALLAHMESCARTQDISFSVNPTMTPDTVVHALRQTTLVTVCSSRGLTCTKTINAILGTGCTCRGPSGLLASSVLQLCLLDLP